MKFIVEVCFPTEAFMLTFDASVHYRVALPPEDLMEAGLERYATA